jgi:hypothetical protein
MAVAGVACHGNDPAKRGTVSEPSSSQATPAAATPAPSVRAVPPPEVQPDNKAADPRPAAAPTDSPAVQLPPGGHDFTTDGKAMLAVGACGDVPAPEAFDAKLLASHCEVIKKAQADYLQQ